MKKETHTDLNVSWFAANSGHNKNSSKKKVYNNRYLLRKKKDHK